MRPGRTSSCCSSSPPCLGCSSWAVCTSSASLVTTRSASRTNGLLAASVARPAALTNGYRLSFAIGAGLVLGALLVAGTVLRPAEEAEDETLRARDRSLGDAAGGGIVGGRDELGAAVRRPQKGDEEHEAAS